MYSLILCLVLIVLGVMLRVRRHRSFESPPFYPGWLPIIGHVHLIFKCDPANVWGFYQEISRKCAKTGGIIVFAMGFRNIYYVTDPEDAHKIANSSIEKNFAYDIAKPWLGNGLLTANGATWRAHRKIISMAFTQQMLDGLIPIFNKQARRLVEQFETQEQTFNHEPLLLINNLEIICQTSLGLDAEKHQGLINEYRKSLRDMFGIMYERFMKIWLHNDFLFNFSDIKKRQDKIISGLHNLSSTILQKRKAELIKFKQDTNSPDVFRPLLDTILESSLDKGLLTDKELREELDTLIFGGHDTSATTLTFIFMLLGSDQMRQEKVFREIIDVIGERSRDVEKDDIPKLTYMECFIKETLRLYPIGPAYPRAATVDIKLKNYMFPAGTSCLIDGWSIQRHPLWGPDAEEFRPERWQDPDKLPEFRKAFFGFGIGKRTCIGKQYAMMSVKVTLVHILRRYKITADISKLTLKMDSLLRPESGHLITIEQRQ